MKVDPKFTFYLGIITTVLQGITSGTIHLTGLVPPDWLPYVTGWVGLAVFINMTILTALNGFSSNASGPLAPPPTIKEAKAVMNEAVTANVALGATK